MEEGSSSQSPARFPGERSVNGKLSSAAFQSFLNANLQRMPRTGSSLIGSFPPIPHLDAAGFLPVASSAEPLSSANRRPTAVDAMSRKLKFPKLEPVDEEEVIAPASVKDQNSLDRISAEQGLKICTSSSGLPGLISFEHIPDISGFSNTGSSSSRFPLLTLPSQLPAPPPPPPTQSPRVPHTAQAPFMLSRLRRKKISDRTRQLEKLMPWEKKMDIATMLEEAHKYIRFLKAQVSVLQAMPRESNFSSAVPGTAVGAGGVGLEKLNRQQLLQVMLNSGAVQDKLYTSGCCVFSVEQMVVLKKMAERKAVQEQMMMMMLGAGGDRGTHF